MKKIFFFVTTLCITFQTFHAAQHVCTLRPTVSRVHIKKLKSTAYVLQLIAEDSPVIHVNDENPKLNATFCFNKKAECSPKIWEGFTLDIKNLAENIMINKSCDDMVLQTIIHYAKTQPINTYVRITHIIGTDMRIKKRFKSPTFSLNNDTITFQFMNLTPNPKNSRLSSITALFSNVLEIPRLLENRTPENDTSTIEQIKDTFHDVVRNLNNKSISADILYCEQ